MTIERKHINMVRAMMEAYTEYRKADKAYKAARKQVEEFNGKDTNTYGIYTITYEDTTSTKTEWAMIAKDLGITEDEAKARYITEKPTRRFKEITKEA